MLLAFQARRRDEYIKGWKGATFSYTHTTWPRREKGKERAGKEKDPAFQPGETLIAANRLLTPCRIINLSVELIPQ